MKIIKEYFEWDTLIWSSTLSIWRKVINDLKLCNSKALDLGARGGGLSLFLANEFACNVICSDLYSPEISASVLHKKYGLNLIKYASVDCTKISYQDNSFDIVIFKSMLGALQSYENQKIALSEMYRVIKPGGILLFAENIKGSKIHQWGRSNFVKWGNDWRYLEYNSELKNILESQFSFVFIDSRGVLSLFCRINFLKPLFYYLDAFLCIFVPNKFRYMAFGYAMK